MASGPLYEKSEKFSKTKGKELLSSTVILFQFIISVAKIIPNPHPYPVTRTRQPENNLMGTDNPITRMIAWGRLKSRFAFIIYQRNIFSSFYLLRWVIDHELHVIH